MAKASITSNRCSICGHADRSVIDHTLACGAEVAATARRFGVYKDSLHRHWENHVSDAWKAAVKMGPYGSREELEKLCLEEGVSVVQGLRALYSSHHAMLIANREAGATQSYLAVAREIRHTLADIGRITGELLPSVANVSVTQNFNHVTYIAGLGEDLIREFGDDPIALEKLHRVLTRRMNDALEPPRIIQGELVHAV